MEEKRKEPCCPLCRRQFETLKEMQKLVDEVSGLKIIIVSSWYTLFY